MVAWLLAVTPAGCAKISAPSIDYAGPTASLDIKATAQNALFSHFTGNLSAASVTVQHAGPAAPVTTAAAANSSAGITTVRLSAAPTFSVDDVVSVTWSGNAVTLVGTPYVVTQNAQYRILTGTLVVQTPWGGLGPGQSGKVCVALQPNAPSDVNVTLSSSLVALTPTQLDIAAGQPKASAAATATAGGFSCQTPKAGGTASSANPQPPACTSANGVTAEGTLNGIAIHGCGIVGESCCGIDGHNCSIPAQINSVCP